MKVLIFFIAVISIIVLFFTSGAWRAVYTSGTWRYKLTLVVDDNGKQIVSSSVREVHVQDQPRITPESHADIRVRGEAVVVDLGKKGVLFALLTGKDRYEDYGFYIVFTEFPFRWKDDYGNEYSGGTELTPAGIRYYSQLKAKKELAFDKLPMLVRLRDSKDPQTVELVDPNDLERTFGKGVKLVSATIEMTDEPVTAEVGKYMPLFDGKYFEWFKKLPYGDFRAIGPYDFRK